MNCRWCAVNNRPLIGRWTLGLNRACSRETLRRHFSVNIERIIAELSGAEWMKQHVDSDKGRAVYAHRMATVEPVFGNLANKGLNRFSLRGKRKVQCQWQLYCLVHNIEKLKNYANLGR